jgi:hypothetical protein
VKTLGVAQAFGTMMTCAECSVCAEGTSPSSLTRVASTPDGEGSLDDGDTSHVGAPPYLANP